MQTAWSRRLADPVVGGATLDRLVFSAIKLLTAAGRSTRRIWLRSVETRREPENRRARIAVTAFRGGGGQGQLPDIVVRLGERGIDLDTLAEAAGQPDADLFDLLCHLAYHAPLRTRRERAERLKREQADFFERYRPEARQVLDALVEKYAEHGAAQFQLPEILEAPPFNEWGNVIEIAARFGGGDRLRGAVDELQRRLYVA